LDPLTDNVISEHSYEQTLEFLREETRGKYKCGVFKLTTSGQPAYGLIFRVIWGDEIRELGSETFEANQKVSEYLYSEPILTQKFPLLVGLRFSDAKAVSGYDNAAGVESIDAFETRMTEVAAKETLMMPAAIDTYKLRIWGVSRGTMIIGGAVSQVIVTYEENLWYSPRIKETAKSVSETTTVVLTELATSITKTREERVLTSYSLT
jgi:hypothetical protein